GTQQNAVVHAYTYSIIRKAICQCDLRGLPKKFASFRMAVNRRLAGGLAILCDFPLDKWGDIRYTKVKFQERECGWSVWTAIVAYGLRQWCWCLWRFPPAFL